MLEGLELQHDFVDFYLISVLLALCSGDIPRTTQYLYILKFASYPGYMHGQVVSCEYSVTQSVKGNVIHHFLHSNVLKIN